MGLALEHANETKNGGFVYRRRVPKDVADLITKREFKRILGKTRAEALKMYPRFHDEVERQISAARNHRLKQSAAQNGVLSGLGLREVAEARVRALLAGSPEPDDVRDIIADNILAAYPQEPEYGEPLGVPELERLTVELLRNPAARPPSPTFQDACELYQREKLNAGEGVEHRSNVQHLQRILTLVKDALGCFPVLASMTRADAHKVRDFMLARRKPDGQPLSPASVQRDLTLIKAVINHGIVELDLRGVDNKFSGLPVKGAKNGPRDAMREADKRHPLPSIVLKTVRSRVLHCGNKELGLIWRMLEGTGCRLAEVTGLRVEDVAPDADTPNIHITWHEDRRVKTASSVRQVPLVGDALAAA